MSNKALSWIILIALSLVWGSSFILMKQGLRAFSSDEVAGLRIVIASAFMLPFLIKHYNKLSVRKNLKGLLLMGVFGNLIPAFLFTKAETQISSSLTGMLNALTPLFTIIIGVLVYKNAVARNKWLGVFIGFMGAVALILFNESNEQSKNVLYCLLVAAATLCYAISVNGIKVYLQEVNSLTATVWSFTLIGPVAAIYLFGFTDVIDHAQHHPEALSSLGYISILAIVGSALSVVIYNTLIKMSGTVFAASCTYLIPIVAIGWGLLDGELVNFYQILSVLIIIAGIWMINAPKKV
ncbi:MAG: putative permease [Bacteroidetes bacterium]|jgi:drug/metabolite transporter (DMT)-like permease|nr:putative permease [Bacteroidota bacterium]MDF2451697.1 putative permease [Bacteroidota bacterium]